MTSERQPRDVIANAWVKKWDQHISPEGADAVLSALKEAGLVVVPVEPTKDMIEAGNCADWYVDCQMDCRPVYADMISAATEGEAEVNEPEHERLAKKLREVVEILPSYTVLAKAADELERLGNALEERGREVYSLRDAIRRHLGHPDGLRDSETCIAALNSDS